MIFDSLTISKINNNKQYVMLFSDILSNQQYPANLINKIKKNHNLITVNYIFNNIKSNNIFFLEDLNFEIICKKIYNQLDKRYKYIIIGLNQGCAISNFFSNKYKQIVKLQILFNNRRMNKENYNKSVIRGNRMIEIKYGKKISTKYKLGIQTNKDLQNKIQSLSSDNKYFELIQHTIMLNIRKQYAKVPIRQYVKTHVFDQLTDDIDIIKNHNMKNDEIKQIKNIYTIDKALRDHWKTNMDKIIHNNNMINMSNIGYVSVDYEINILDSSIFTKNRINKLLYLLNV